MKKLVWQTLFEAVLLGAGFYSYWRGHELGNWYVQATGVAFITHGYIAALRHQLERDKVKEREALALALSARVAAASRGSRGK